VEARFAKQREMAEKAEKKLNELRSSISFALPHELRTPLASILGFAQVLSDDPNSLTLEEIAQAARVIQKAGTRLQRLLENFLIYTRIQVAMQEPKQLSALRIAGILHSRELISSTAQRRAGLWNRLVDLKTDLVYSPVAVSEEHFVKIVEELVDNAFKFSVLGSEVRLSTSITNEHFELTITDHGRGMTAQQLADVGAYMQFGRKFYEQQGAGLGLAIVKGLTEIHGGKLEFGNTTGGGLTLRLILPVYPAERRAQT
jgi:signal transduction histidine kinase